MSVANLAYNGTAPDGGDSLTFNVNLWYTTGDVGWIITASALVLFMIPGVGFFYSGLTGTKSALSLITLSFITLSVVSFQWFLFGYSLVFSKNGNKYIGNMDNVGLTGVLAQKSGDVPDLVMALFQGMFAAFTPVLVIGAAAERGRILPCMVFIFIWSTIVYDPIASWTWNSVGWAYQLGVLDFAGGTPVHITSGASALAYAMMLGPRQEKLNSRPHNTTYIALGTIFIWIGWLGFNGGSAKGCNLRAVMACVVTNLAASVGALTWLFIDYYQLERKWGTIGWCSGAVAGLVAITPAAGFVPPWSAVIFGVVGSICCNFATRLKYYMGIDEHLDIFAIHGVGGIVGNLLTGLFAADYIAALDGSTEIKGGWVNHNYIQLGYQASNSAIGFVYAFVVTYVLLYLMNCLPGLALRVSEEAELRGIDETEIGQFAYDYTMRHDVELADSIQQDCDRDEIRL